MIKKFDIFIVILFTAFLYFALYQFSSHSPDTVRIDADSIISRGTLISVTDYNSTNYFIFRGEPMGFNYELLKAYSTHLGVNLVVVTCNSPADAIKMLRSGNADLLAIGLTEYHPDSKKIKLTESIYETPQVLVQRKPVLWRTLQADSVERMLVRDHVNLSGKTIYVQEGSSHSQGLRLLTRETGKKLTVKEVPYISERLIQLVAEGEIDFAVCDGNVAQVNSTYYPDIDVNTIIGNPRGIAWGTRKVHSSGLLKDLNQWIPAFRKTRTYAILYDKYFENSRSGRIVRSNYYVLSTGRISAWDELIKIYSDSINWDWRLLASLICQESRFEPYTKSWAGAYGLMQVMPETGRNFGIDIRSTPGNNIRAGILYIGQLQKIFSSRIPDETERNRFILGAYNAGPGHILDAMKLAEKNGMDPRIWNDNVAVWLMKKSDPKYYNDTVVKNGYFRGRESISFVDEILERYEHYRNIVPEKQKK